jgi:hypothetical protein
VLAAGSFFRPPVDSTGRFRRRRYAGGGDSGSEGVCSVARPLRSLWQGEDDMNNIIYLIGLVVVVVAILAFFGLR